MNPYPYLNGTGWCTDPELVMTAILSDYCYCEYSATKLYRQHIKSLPYQLMKYTDAQALASVVQDDLNVLYKSYFDNVECIVEYNEDNQQGIPSQSPRFRLEISLIVFDGNRRYELAKIIGVKNGVVVMMGETVA